MDAQENELLTRVGSGTPAGETLRKYWLPVGFSCELSNGTPKLVRWLGEDLVLFRDEFGRVGLMEPTCAHRGTSLEFGWIEGGGLRCCYHGWVYDVNGHCIEQPGEPAGSTFKDKIRLKAYPVQELGEMLWAYMGGGNPPELPKYDFLVRTDGERGTSSYVRECNYLQQLENALDPIHATFLHGRRVQGVIQAPEWKEFPHFEVSATESIAYYVARRKGPKPETEWHREVAYFPPIMVVHNGGTLPGDPEPALSDVAWRMPIDDFTTQTFTVRFYPHVNGLPMPRKRTQVPADAPLLRGTKKQYDMTTINGQDSAAQESQGRIADRAREHLATSDRGVIQVRKLWKAAIEASVRGAEPPNLIRATQQNRIVHADVIEKLVKPSELRDHIPQLIFAE